MGKVKVFIDKDTEHEFKADGADQVGIMVRFFNKTGIEIPGQGQPIAIIRQYNVSSILGFSFDEDIVVGL